MTKKSNKERLTAVVERAICALEQLEGDEFFSANRATALVKVIEIQETLDMWAAGDTDTKMKKTEDLEGMFFDDTV
jgi:hypothetical protein